MQFRRLMFRAAGAAVGLVFALHAFADSRQYFVKQADAMDRRRAVTFSANRGQAPAEVLFQARGQGFEASFERDAFVLRVLTGSGKDIHATEQRIALAGASPRAVLEPLDRQPGTLNFFLGNDPTRWVRKLATYARLRYRNVYPGIDLLFYDNHGKLEYDFVVKPGADPSLIRLRVDGSAPSHVTAGGELLSGEGANAVVHRPLLYQNLPTGKHTVAGHFVEKADGTVGFEFAKYDPTRTLVIDPTLNLLYSTYLGGIHDDVSSGITLDAHNNMYIVGASASQDYPVSGNAYQTARKNIGVYVYNLVITKLSPSGTLLYSTFVGGTETDTTNYSNVLVDANGNAYLTGYAESGDFPVTANAYQGTFSGAASNCAVLVEIGPDGSQLVYSTFFSGSGGSQGNGIEFNAQGKLYMVGTAGAGLPTTAGAYMKQVAAGSNAAFVAEFDLTQTGSAQLVAATYYGATTPSSNSAYTGNLGYTMVLDAAGNPWISGQSYTTGLPTTTNALQPTLPAITSSCQGYGVPLNSAAYIAKLSGNLSSLMYGSYLSGKTAGTQADDCDEFARSLAVDSSGNLYITGSTASSTFPVTTGVNQPTYSGAGGYYGYVGFVTKLNSTGTAILWSSYLGGNGGDTFPVQLKLDSSGNVWVAGTTQGGSNFPITQGSYQTTQKGSYNGHLEEYSADGTKLLYGTYLGGGGTDSIQALTFDALGNVYLTGDTTSTNFPVSANAFQPLFANGDINPDHNDIFVSILGLGAIGAVSPTTGYNSGDTTVTISGLGFQQGASCALVMGSTTIAATSVNIASNGTSMSCTFALAGVATGSYDIVVTQPGGAGTLDDHGAFTVDSGSGQTQAQTKVWASLAGRPAIRVGVPNNLVLNYGNTGGVNAYITVIWVVLPSSYTYSIASMQFPTDPNCPSLSALPLAFTSNGSTYIPILIPIIAAGSSNSLIITVTAPAVAPGQELSAYAEAPWFDSLTLATLVLENAAASPEGALAYPCLADPDDPSVNDCFGAVAAEMAPGVAAYMAAYSKTDPLVAVDTTTQLATLLLSLLNQSAAQGGASLPYSWSVLASEVGIDLLQKLYGIGNQCTTQNIHTALGLLLLGYKPPPKPPQIVLNCPDEDQLGFGADFIDDMDPCFDQDDDSSVDPNDKKGPSGDNSSSHFLRPLSPFVYTVAFENQASATLPASQVVVTDQLDPTKVNLSTLTLGNIGFGTTTISLAGGTNNFNTTYSINSSMSVKIQGSLNPNTGLLTWTFTTIDPSTNLPPTDPTVGFLPPDANGVEGQGSVMFSVMPQSGLATGTEISNQATVVFDANAPLQTPTWLNTIDVTPPTSAVQALPSTETVTSFPVTWAGSDSGSGVASYSTYVSDNGGAFTQWLNQTTSTSAAYAGVPSHTYGFYSIATDKAGNVQPAKTTADASTTVSSLATPFGLSPTSANAPATASTGIVNVTAPTLSAAWAANSNVSWITVTGGSPGAGNGTVTYAVAANSGLQRVGTMTIAGLTFTVTQAGTISTSGLGFYPVTPCRVVDTRNGNGTFGGPIMAAGSTRVFPIPASACAIPSTALAYSLNITVVPPAPLTYLTVWPTGEAQPYVSTLNSFNGAVVANAAIVPAGTSGEISVYVSDSAQVIIDINGYFTTPDANALAFYPLTPCRIADTRAGQGFSGSFGPPQMAANTSRVFPVQSSSCSVPANARAYSLNMTAVPPGPLTYLTTWPTGVTQPVVSTLNAFNGQVVANAAIVPAGTSGEISVYVSNASDVLIDINGYFAPPGNGALFFYPLTPCRIADTRTGQGFSGSFGPPSLAAGSTRNFAIGAGGCSVPNAAQAYSLNMTVVPPGPLFYLSTWPAGQPQPVVSTLNDLQGTTIANAAIVPAGGTGGPISVYVSDPTNLIIDINGYFGQ